MWNTDKQQRLDDLQQRDEHEPLTPDEQKRLDALVYELEQAEWAALRPALSRLRDEQASLQVNLHQVQARNEALSALAERYADLLTRAREQLAGLISEREELRTEYERVVQ